MQTALQDLSAGIRRTIIEQAKSAGVGHIGSCLSVADALAALYGGPLRLGGPADPGRDRVIMSKGHAALALYAALHLTGRLSQADLDTYCGDGSLVSGHPEHDLDWVEFSTGSLGHGLSLGAGVALGLRQRQLGGRVCVLMSDAECNEGSVWEAVMFAAQHRLSDLIALVDVNGQQALGPTKAVIDLEPLGERFGAFGWDVRELDGHDPDALASAIAEPAAQGSPPRVLLLDTVFGKGVSYMERDVHWHYWPMSDEDYRRALTDLAANERSPA